MFRIPCAHRSRSFLRRPRRESSAAACRASLTCSSPIRTRSGRLRYRLRQSDDQASVTWPLRRPQGVPIAAHWRMSRERYKRAAALDDVTVALPVRLHGRADRAGRRRQVDPARMLAGVRSVQTGQVNVLGGDMADAAPPQRDLSAYRLHAAGARQESLSRPLRLRKRRFLRPAVRPIAAERDWRIDDLLDSTDLTPFADRPAGSFPAA